MQILPRAPKIDPKEGFSTSNDIFGLKSLADGMTNIVSSVEDPLVIAFDGQWGSGKSTFLRQWEGELRKLHFPVIHFDAFENDYLEDAFAALAREVLELAEEEKGPTSVIVEDFKDKAVRC